MGSPTTPRLKRLSLLSYRKLKRYHVHSRYKLCAISKAAGILKARKKSIKRGYETKGPYAKKPLLESCSSFKLVNGKIRFPMGKKEFQEIPPNNHTLAVLQRDPRIRVNSFILTRTALSLCISKEVEEMKDIGSCLGVDRNLRNLTVGNQEKVTYYDKSKIVEIGENRRGILGSFKRNDVRVKHAIFSKYGWRMQRRVRQILHLVSKAVVQEAKESKSAVVFDD